MILYKKINGHLHYWETWGDPEGKSAIIHWGIVGERGEVKNIYSDASSSFEEIGEAELNDVLEKGYEEIEDYDILYIEYKVDDMGTAEDLQKRHALQDRMDETLGGTGLGFCDGGSIGSGTMEVCCFVVDVEIALKVIREDLKDTEFNDYLRIYEEGIDD